MLDFTGDAGGFNAISGLGFYHAKIITFFKEPTPKSLFITNLFAV
jgi:hypothetical protein